MMDDIIANAFDEDGKMVELKVKDCYRTYYDMLKLLYFDYMSRVVDGDYDSFKKIHSDATERMIKLIHHRYADHVEGIRMGVFDRNKIDDPQRKQIDG